jgi:hypothetical protein
MDDNPKPVLLGYLIEDLCHEDGKVKFGTFENFCFNQPLSFNTLQAKNR